MTIQLLVGKWIKEPNEAASGDISCQSPFQFYSLTFLVCPSAFLCVLDKIITHKQVQGTNKEEAKCFSNWKSFELSHFNRSTMWCLFLYRSLTFVFFIVPSAKGQFWSHSVRRFQDGFKAFYCRFKQASRFLG